MRAIDLFHILRSFLPKNEHSVIKKISILPSLFGLERMKKENEQGPEGIWNEGDDSDNEDDLDSLESEDDDNDSEDDKKAPKLKPLLPMTRKRMIQQDKEAFNTEKLRKYQTERLKYYFAIVECDSKETALFLYQNCNDVEIEHTSNRFDMRFIPDEIEFDKSQIPKDTATSAPIDHQLPSFHTKALQHSRVKLTWDQDDPERKELTKKLRDDSLYSDNLYLPLSEERQLKKFLANSDSESSSDSESDSEGKQNKKKKQKKVRKKYASLLDEIHNSDVQSMFGKDNSENQNFDMEITFTPGLSDSVQDLVDKTIDNNSEKTPWERYLDKREKKQQAKKVEKKLHLQQVKQKEMEEREKRKKERKKLKKLRNKDGKSMDDGEEIDPELALLVSGSNTKKQQPSQDDDDELDDRFKNVLTNPNFGFDRTNPLYKGSSSYVKKVHRKRAELKAKVT